jgi:hypothetical protein
VQAAPGFEGGRLLGQLQPHLARLSSVVLVELGWDEARASFVRAVEAQGVAAGVIVAGELAGGEDPRATAPVRCVPLAAIQQGQEIAL